MQTKEIKSPAYAIIMALFFTAISVTQVLASNEPLEIEDGASSSAVAVAVVTAISPETRELTLKDGDNEFTFVAGPEVRNFDQIKRGDLVLVGYYTGLMIDLKPANGEKPSRLDVIELMRAPKGDKPGGAIRQTIHAVGVVEQVNKKDRTVKIQGAKKTVILKASKDIDLDKVKKGDRVEATFTTLYAVQVEPAPKVSGTIKLKTTSVAAGIGYEWGSGTMTMYDGTTWTFKVKGLSIIDVGISTIEAAGDVYHLVVGQDLEGTYITGEAGATFIAGGSASTLKNDKGVVIKLKSTQKGLKFTLAPGGLTISEVKQVKK